MAPSLTPVEAFSASQERAAAAIADRVCRERLAAAPARRGRPPKSESRPEDAPAPRYAWLHEGQLLATPADVMRALQIGRSTLYQLIAAGELPTSHVRGRLRFDPHEVEVYVARLRRKDAA